MAKYGEGLGSEIVKAVIKGEIIEPITFEKVKAFCNRSGIQASEKHMRVILSNATKNTHSPSYRTYFERIGKGEYILTPEFSGQHRYFWLNVDTESYNWAFSNVKVGSRQGYSNINSTGSKRKNESCFKNAQTGDLVIAYETGETKAITSICKVVGKHEDNIEIIINFQKTRDFNVFLDLETLKNMNNLSDCQVIQNHRGTLLELEERHFDIIIKKLEGLNQLEDPFDILNREVQKSLSDGSVERKKRLESRTILVPEIYETISIAYRRNPDVIAEVLVRANGVCEECEKPAPFIKRYDGTPYLEVHHMVRLADGGEDTVNNAIGVCPTCHRKLHFG